MGAIDAQHVNSGSLAALNVMVCFVFVGKAVLSVSGTNVVKQNGSAKGSNSDDDSHSGTNRDSGDDRKRDSGVYGCAMRARNVVSRPPCPISQCFSCFQHFMGNSKALRCRALGQNSIES